MSPGNFEFWISIRFQEYTPSHELRQMNRKTIMGFSPLAEKLGRRSMAHRTQDIFIAPSPLGEK
jgi:hypothetical protein